ncbi:related to GTPase-activating protein gyp10 [Fusarium fujikuroi]|nr:related to GTPase-activating protein gyp10 [Fusarium fujikuroi]SCO15111.1 related to GTPase-activating protein gyp10 [Fusarium fujikuroi]SCO23417.1 related to GTPase-activating protein gyp10 [Fusarium fujikuroi]SCO54960.1 related to GTPase-activating protein gyp10 [Fusarium fujikuroi]SCV58941.1 related to GTPase-activating protein gyp10 [Fusarium fujikuroi]
MDNPTDSDNKSPLSFTSTNIETSQEPDMLSHPKAADIIKACEWRDIGRLRSLAEAHGGFLSDALRRQAWPILLGLDAPSDEKDDPDLALPQEESNAWKQLPRHRDEDQVQLDVNRSFIYYPANQSDAELSLRKSELSSLITEVLRRYPYLCYFQGYHDISQVLLLVLAPTWRARVLARLSVLRIRDFMLPNFGPTTAQLRLLPDIIHAADPKLRRHLAGVEPFYALAGTLTMYAHNIETYQDIARLFDVFLAREPVFTVYVFAQIILDRRNEIFEIDEPDMLHVILGKVPTKMDLDELIIKSAALFGQHPPETLSYWRHISNFSALKTARDIETCAKQTMEEGSELFEKQVKELHWQEMWDHIKLVLWRYRRPAKTVGMALVVGALAFYLRRNPILVHRIASFFSP